jgi:cysteine desulfurase
MPDKPVYLDYASSTPLDPEVIRVMTESFRAHHGNAHAPHHAFGAASAQAVQQAKSRIAAVIDAEGPETLTMTASATEANNLCLLGLAAHLRARGKTHIVAGGIEHRSVLGPLEELARQGFTLSLLPAKPDGVLDAAALPALLTPETGLVSVQAVNNVLGTVQPLSQVAQALAGKDILLHSDVAQALDRIAFSVQNVHADFATISAHKTYGPQGIAALYIRPGREGLLTPLMHGSRHALRPGTLPVALCEGFGVACRLAAFSAGEHARLEMMRRDFIAALQAKFKNLVVYGAGEEQGAPRVPGILCLRVPGVKSADWLRLVPDVAFGLLAEPQPAGAVSPVMCAIADDTAAREALRISFGRFTTPRDLERAAAGFILAAGRL